MVKKMFSHKVFAKFRTALVVITLPISFIILTPKAVHASNFSNMYVFGDSLSDVGQDYKATYGLFPPAAVPFISPLYSGQYLGQSYVGRFTNGPNWIDYLSADLGLPKPTLQNDFAEGGATSGYDNVASSFFPWSNLVGLQQQIAGFTQKFPNNADPNALYVIWAGANDFAGDNQTNPSIPVSNVANAIKALAQDGAKDILVPNLPNLGKLPGLSGGDRTALAALSLGYDALLAQILADLGTQLAPQGVKLIPMDVNSLFNNALDNPSQYGFTNVSDSCLVNSPIGVSYNPAEPISVCDNPTQYLFWDYEHPTTTTHQIIAAEALRTLHASAVPEPSSTSGLMLFGAFLAGVMGLKQKRKIALTPMESKKPKRSEAVILDPLGNNN